MKSRRGGKGWRPKLGWFLWQMPDWAYARIGRRARRQITRWMWWGSGK